MHQHSSEQPATSNKNVTSKESSSVPDTAGSNTSLAASKVGREVRTSVHQRLTFSMESKTQDLLQLGARLKDTDYTQNQFEIPTVKRNVAFRRIGRLSLNRAVLRRRPIIFKQLGKLNTVSCAPHCVPLADISNSAVKKHSSMQTPRTASRPSATQTDPKSFRWFIYVFQTNLSIIWICSKILDQKLYCY